MWINAFMNYLEDVFIHYLYHNQDKKKIGLLNNKCQKKIVINCQDICWSKAMRQSLIWVPKSIRTMKMMFVKL